MLVIRPTLWKLANSCVPTFYIKAEPTAHTPQVYLEIVEPGAIVKTPYDTGFVKSVRNDDMLVIQPMEWKLANGCIPTFYIKQTPPLHTPGYTAVCKYKVGDIVDSTYGKGKITEIRKNDCLVITPVNWMLANNCVPTFYIKATPPSHTPGVSISQ